MTNLQRERTWIYFLTYSCLGWGLEVLFVALTDGGFTNRGFLFGPYCPIYGIGCLNDSCHHKKHDKKPHLFYSFCHGYLWHFRIFHQCFYGISFYERWWDYSNFFFQIDGRICLETLVPFGILSYLITCQVHPRLEKLVFCFHRTLLHTITRYTFVLFLVDFLTTLWRQLQ